MLHQSVGSALIAPIPTSAPVAAKHPHLYRRWIDEDADLALAATSNAASGSAGARLRAALPMIVTAALVERRKRRGVIRAVAGHMTSFSALHVAHTSVTCPREAGVSVGSGGPCRRCHSTVVCNRYRGATTFQFESATVVTLAEDAIAAPFISQT